MDFKNCKNIWVDSGILYDTDIETINENKYLKTLIITDTDILGEYLMINNPSVEAIIISGNALSKEYDFDFTECQNLKIFSMGNLTEFETLEGLRGLKDIEVVNFGYIPSGLIQDSNNTFDTMRELCKKPYDLENDRISKPNNSFIHDISAIQGSNVKVLNISGLYALSSEKLYETARNLPELEEIVGLELNNAEMCSKELIDYCEEHSIKQPFTEKSMEIKKELRRIVEEYTTPEMSQEEKIKELSKYIINLVSYNFEYANSEQYI